MRKVKGWREKSLRKKAFLPPVQGQPHQGALAVLVDEEAVLHPKLEDTASEGHILAAIGFQFFPAAGGEVFQGLESVPGFALSQGLLRPVVKGKPVAQDGLNLFQDIQGG